MLKLNKVAVTGGLSCGKSSVCRFLKEFGAYVVSADDIVHQLLSPETNLGLQIISLLGRDILVNNHLDRSKIAKKVFNNPNLLKSLEKLLHPEVRNEIELQYEMQKNSKASLFVAEIPLLFEGDGFDIFDYTIAVIANAESCKKRFQETKGYDVGEYDRRSALQLSLEEKAKRANFVIENNGTINELRNAVKEVYNIIIPALSAVTL